jgi:hypothetical protein
MTGERGAPYQWFKQCVERNLSHFENGTCNLGHIMQGFAQTIRPQLLASALTHHKDGLCHYGTIFITVTHLRL